MKKIVSIIIILFLLIIIKNIVASIMDSFDDGKTVGNLNEALESKKRENEFLKQKLVYVKTNEFVEQEARNKLNLSKKGEYVVIGPSEIKQEEIIIQEIPNWKKWLKIFSL